MILIEHVCSKGWYWSFEMWKESIRCIGWTLSEDQVNTKWTQVKTSGHPSDFDGLSLYIDDMIE